MQVGDVVKLKGDGPKMTIIKKDQKNYFTCAYWCEERNIFELLCVHKNALELI